MAGTGPQTTRLSDLKSNALTTTPLRPFEAKHKSTVNRASTFLSLHLERVVYMQVMQVTCERKQFNTPCISF